MQWTHLPLYAMLLAAPAGWAANPTETEAGAIATTLSATAAEQAVRRGAMVLDLRSADAYAQGHLPGALSAPGAATTLDRAGLQALVSRLGLDLSRGTVVVGEPGEPAAQAFQAALQTYAPAPVRWLVGGVREWQLGGRALQATAAQRPPVPHHLAAPAAPNASPRMAGASMRDLAMPAQQLAAR